MEEKVKRPVTVWIAMGLLVILGVWLVVLPLFGEDESVLAREEAADGIAEIIVLAVTPVLNGLGCLLSVVGIAKGARWGRILAKAFLVSELVFAPIEIFLFDSDFYSEDPLLRLSTVIWFAGHISMAIAAMALLTFGDAVNSYFDPATTAQGDGKLQEPPPPPVFEG